MTESTRGNSPESHDAATESWTAFGESWDEFVERVSRELYAAEIHHHVVKKPGQTLSLNIGGVAAFKSLRVLAAALERVDADFRYSAGSGFTLYRGVAP